MVVGGTRLMEIYMLFLWSIIKSSSKTYSFGHVDVATKMFVSVDAV
jgi:hypothetical protein